MKIYFVMSPECNEGDCDCYHADVEAIYLSEEKAKEHAKRIWRGFVECHNTED